MSSKKGYQYLRRATKMAKQNEARNLKPLNRVITPLVQTIDEPASVEPRESIFSQMSTFDLMKKITIYRLMGNSLVLDYAPTVVNAMYKVMGKRITSGIINNTAGSIFTSGEDTEALN
jgi:hypothetical protein